VVAFRSVRKGTSWEMIRLVSWLSGLSKVGEDRGDMERWRVAYAYAILSDIRVRKRDRKHYVGDTPYCTHIVNKRRPIWDWT